MFYEVVAKVTFEDGKKPATERFLVEERGIHEAELAVIKDLSESGLDYEITSVKVSSIKKVLLKEIN